MNFESSSTIPETANNVSSFRQRIFSSSNNILKIQRLTPSKSSKSSKSRKRKIHQIESALKDFLTDSDSEDDSLKQSGTVQ